MKKAAIILATCLLASSCTNPTRQTSVSTVTVTINSSTVTAEVARTQTEMEQGLSGRESLGENQGMLFDFGTNANTTPTFWMKDMKFDLDFIWIKSSKVIYLTKNVPRPKQGTLDSELIRYTPPSAVDRVLEVNAGWADRHGVKLGDEVKIENYSN